MKDKRFSIIDLNSHWMNNWLNRTAFTFVHSGAMDQHIMFSEGSGSSGSGTKKTFRVGRRRPSGPEGTAERERAEAPRRQRPSAPAPQYPSSSGTGGQAGAPISLGNLIPGGGSRSSCLVIGVIVLLVICIVPVLMSQGVLDTGDLESAPPAQVFEPVETEETFVEPPPTVPSLVLSPTKAPKKTSPPSSSTAGGNKWLVMLYQDADDKILEQDIYVDLNEAERVGSTDNVQIVAQVDRFNAGYQGDGDWTSTKRFYITQDNDLQRVRSEQIADLGEANMADAKTLVDFVTWAVQSYPADKYVLILSDHGMGWPGGWSDPTSNKRGDANIPLTTALGDQLFMMELDQALGDIRSQTGLDKFELIGMDACLMSHLEVLDALAPHARYAVASQEVEPSLGWAYASFLQALNENPSMSGGELGELVVQSYIQEDQRIVDPQARADFLRQSSPMAGMFGGVTAEQITQQLGKNITLAAIDLEAIPDLTNSLSNLAYELQNADQRVVAQARSYALSFTNVFGSQVPAAYLDLGNFVQLLKRESNDSAIAQAADQVLGAINNAVIAEKHGPNKRGSTGVSIYFPNSQLYRSAAAGPQSYTAIASRFAQNSLWDDFLYFHYTGRTFAPAENAIAVPQRGETIEAPAAGQIQVTPIQLSSDTASPGNPVLLSTDISGPNVGYVKLFAGFYDQASNSIFVSDMDYLESPDTREVDGVYYPDWGDGSEFTLEFEWEPIVFAISDGVDSAVALFAPQAYGATPEEAIYTVEGTYTFADGGETRFARLSFSNGVLRQVFGFTNSDGTGAPREITPQAGDTFTILEKWMDLDQSGNVSQVATQEGKTLTFGDQPFTWEELDAAAGMYIVGFIVEDLDGNAYEVYTQVNVR